MENGPFIVDLPIIGVVIFHIVMLVYQRVPKCHPVIPVVPSGYVNSLLLKMAH